MNGSVEKLWRYEDGALPNTLAIGYVLVGHIAGLAAITASNLLINLLGTILLASALIVAGYLIHELAHSLVFKTRRNNTRLGEIMLWLCGSSYASFERIRSMHLRHHADRADVACFNHEAFIRKAPAWLRRAIFLAEWLHVPAVELVMHVQVIVKPFRDKRYDDQRFRVIITGISRLAFFAILFVLNPWSLVFYAIAYLLFVKALFLAEAFAHTYEVYYVSHHRDPVPKAGRDASYDQDHTYSNIVSRRFPWLNLYNLNFGYHNAHHDKPTTPWYRLPQLQAKMYDASAPQYLPYREVMVSFHKNRTRCILASEHPSEHPSEIVDGAGRADGFLGVHGVSFLSIV